MDQFRPKDDQFAEFERGLEDVKRVIRRNLSGKGIWIALIVIALLYLGSGFYSVGPGEQGVELLFGKVTSQTEPGLQYRLPWPFMSHTIVEVAKVRRAEIGFRTQGTSTRSRPEEALMLTGDENIVDVQFIVQYVVQDPVKFLYGCKNPEQALRASVEVALRGVVGENTIDYTMTKGRLDVQNQVQVYLQKLLDQYNTGLIVTEARLHAVDPPAQVQEAFHDVVRAWEDRERLIREAEGYQEDIVPKARGIAAQEIRKAEAYQEQRVIRAEGDAKRFTEILEEYSKAPKVTRERIYLERLQEFLPGTKKVILGGQNSSVLPLFPFFGSQHMNGVKPAPVESTTPTEKKGR